MLHYVYLTSPKPDNCMVRLGDSEEDWESLYQASGDGGWSSKGMMLVDWGSAIDILSFPEDQRFCSSRIGVKPDPSIECWEVRHDRSWTYELDWYAVAGVIHVLLFGTYMEVVEEDDGTDIPRLALASHFKRYWQADLWKDLFDLLLNSGRLNAAMLVEGQDTTESLLNSLDAGLVGPGTDFEVLEQEFPIVKNIHSKRMELEAWLKENSCKSGKSLRNLLRRVEITLLEHNK